MTMFTLPNFCRVCLKYDKNLIDLAHIENEPSETLMSKLQLCVSEVEWTAFKPLLCHPCIKRLNIAYGFKKQCVQSAGVLKNYVELVKESQKKESQKNENTVPPGGGAYMLLPNQKYVKILVGPQNPPPTPNTFQNVFLNLIPATSLNSVTPPQPIAPITTGSITPKSKDSNQNVFLNLNNTFQKFIPMTSPRTPPVPRAITVEVPSKKSAYLPKANIANVNVNQLLTESKSEEVSVEIDPTVFGLEGEEEDSNEEEINDYDEVISSAKITLKDLKTNGEQVQNGKDDYKQFIPILPKQDDFLTSGQHFLFSTTEPTNGFVCEHCQKSFSTKKILKVHINHFHLGKMPFKCEYCYLDYATRSDYENCVKNHRSESDALNKSLTLEDFMNNSNDSSQIEVEATNIEPSENGIYVCDVCRRPFNSSTGLLRHKVRKHNQKNKKKYFIKGMKNARCDICNREFSTQSYLQLHRKLHMRDDIGYKYKVFGKSKYGELEGKEEKDVEKDDDKKSEKQKESSEEQEEKPAESKDQKDELRTTENLSSSSGEGDEQQVEVSASDKDMSIKEEPLDIKMEVDDEFEENSEQDENSNPDDGQDTDDGLSEENN